MSYNPRAYEPTAVTVDIVALTIRDDGLNVLLVERGEEPFLGRLALPGGFVRSSRDAAGRLRGETLDQAAARELAEETGLRPGHARLRRVHLEQLATYSAVDRDPRMRVFSVAYLALAADLPDPVAGGDAAAAAWVPVDRADGRSASSRAGADGRSASSRAGGRLAFDHATILADGLERARAKLEYTPLATSFVGPEFTIVGAARGLRGGVGRRPARRELPPQGAVGARLRGRPRHGHLARRRARWAALPALPGRRRDAAAPGDPAADDVLRCRGPPAARRAHAGGRVRAASSPRRRSPLPGAGQARPPRPGRTRPGGRGGRGVRPARCAVVDRPVRPPSPAAPATYRVGPRLAADELAEYRCAVDRRRRGRAEDRPAAGRQRPAAAARPGPLRVPGRAPGTGRTVPELRDSFTYRDQSSGADHVVNVLDHPQGMVSLAAVRSAYPDGLDPRDVAWMWRRLLVALGVAHRAGLVHGAVLPDQRADPGRPARRRADQLVLRHRRGHTGAGGRDPLPGLVRAGDPAATAGHARAATSTSPPAACSR